MKDKLLTDAQRDSECDRWANSFVDFAETPIVLPQSRQCDFKQGFDAARTLMARCNTSDNPINEKMLLALKAFAGVEDFNGWHEKYADAISLARLAIEKATSS